jgi:hypothetical protein
MRRLAAAGAFGWLIAAALGDSFTGNPVADAEPARDAPPPAEIVIPSGQAPRTLALSSGRSVTLLSLAPLASPEGWAGLALVYETALPLDDAPALRREVDEIWQRVVPEIVASHADKALIVARARGTAAHSSVKFLFTAQGDGWCTAESADRLQAGLDPAFVREFIARFDWLVAQRAGWAAALYLAPAWRGTATTTERGKTERSTLDRGQFVAAVQVADQAIQDDLHRREILAIAIDPDGKSARVESREIETFRRGGERIRSDGRSVDVLRLIDDHVQLIESSDEATNSVD